ncbi:MAG TPA: T9SS type A sorting domain-containing protein, partial [Bacteroidales bacterium]|nr:T9SS type A sorting domain-containing protein [Bacteroidales bacterium]
LDLQSGQLLAEYSGDFSASTPPPSVVSLSGKMYILFTTNSSVTDEGWNASWTTYPLGVQERQNLQYQVFPNPASGKVYIQMYESSKKELSLEFISIDGKVQLSENFTTTEGLNRKAIDISGLQAGIYVLRIIGDDGMVTRKVVVE